jgi:penicillin-binding protein 1B
MKKPAKVKKGRKVYSLVFAAAAAFAMASAAGALIYCLLLSQKIEQSFSGRRWRAPSRVYSDSTILYPGQIVNRTLLNEKIHRLGYRRVSHVPQRRGEARAAKDFLELFTQGPKAGSRPAPFCVRIKFADSQIVSIERTDGSEALSMLELEPEELMRFYGPDHERREVVALKQIPRHLVHAVLSAEDKRFYRHHGFDPAAILRAVYTNLRHGEIRAGGSTITQQLAKCYFLTSRRTLRRKLKEFFMAITLETMCGKEEILEMYLNEIYFGQKGILAIHGIAEAAMFYFGKSASELSIAESAALAGLIRGPNRYSPYVSSDRCRTRRNSVLKAMRQNGWITEDELQRALGQSVSAAGYTLNEKKASYFMDYVSGQMAALYATDVLTGSGLSIYTTLDTQVQMAAEWALEKGLSRLEQSRPGLRQRPEGEKLQGAIVVMQPRSGAILALAGGRSYRKSQFNRITQARRQPGSAFKPFVYVGALDDFFPTSMLSNQHQSYLQGNRNWVPKNIVPVDDLSVTLKRALAQSINLPTVNLAVQLGLENIIKRADAFGFTTPIKAYPSLALGAFEVIPLELARAYCVFAADGVLPYPLSVKKVVDEDGHVLERRHTAIERVISPAKAFLMTSMLRGVVTDGTARKLKERGVTVPVAGKTGTSNDYRDAWFVGYTPDVLALVWVGLDDGTSLRAGGATAAMPIWADLIKAIPRYVSGGWFKVPPGVVTLKICTKSNRRATEKACPKTEEEFFLQDNAPADTCRAHRGAGRLKQIFKGIYDFFKKD